MPTLPANALALVLALANAACAAAPPTPRSPATFVIPTELANGRVEITISPSYPRGATMTIPVLIAVTRGSVTGPLTARIMASGINEGGAPAEVLVRELAVRPATVGAGSRTSTTLTWDSRDAHGAVVPADAYSLVVEVRSDDGGTSRVVVAGATIELR